MTAMAQLTHTITNHAPTGEYYVTRAEHFPDKETLCTNCSLAVIQTHRHISLNAQNILNIFPPSDSGPTKRTTAKASNLSSVKTQLPSPFQMSLPTSIRPFPPNSFILGNSTASPFPAKSTSLTALLMILTSISAYNGTLSLDVCTIRLCAGHNLEYPCFCIHVAL